MKSDLSYLQFSLAALAFPLFSACTPSDPSSLDSNFTRTGIISGTKAAISDPISQSTVYIKTFSGDCTGILLSTDVVLTAAHCFDIDPAGFTNALVTYRSGDKDSLCSAAVITDVAYDPQAKMVAGVHQPDIALVKLDSPLCQTSVAVLDGRAALDSGVTVTIAGHGRGTTGDQPDVMDLRLISRESSVIDELNADLNRAIPSEKKQLERTEQFLKDLPFYQFAIPAQAGQSMCFGDSGGPVFKVEEGVVHVLGINGAILPNSKKGTAQCENGYFQLYTPVGPSMQWLESKLQNW